MLSKNALRLLAFLVVPLMMVGHGEAWGAVSKRKKHVPRVHMAPVSGGAAVQSVMAEVPKEMAADTPFHFGLSLGHFFSYRTDVSPVTSITANATYRLNSRDQLGLAWNLNKFYNISVVEDEFALDDPTLVYNHILHPDYWGLKWNLKLGATAPVSKQSRTAGITSRPSISIGVSRQFFDHKLTLAYNLGYQYNILQYLTTIDGLPLNQSALSNVFVAGYALSDHWALNLSVLMSYNFLADNPNQTGEVYNNGRYGFDGNILYHVANHVNARVGMSQNDQFMKNGRYEINLYDPMTVRYYLAVDLAY